MSLVHLMAIDDEEALCQAALADIEKNRDEAVQLGLVRQCAFQALYARGYTYSSLGKLMGLSAPRVGQIVGKAEPHVMKAFKAWAPVARFLREQGIEPATAWCVLEPASGVDPSLVRVLGSVHKQYRALLMGAEFREAELPPFVADCEYAYAVLVLWRHQGGTLGQPGD